MPFGRKIIEAQLDKRLAVLSSKGNPTGREIRHHQKEKLFCLPYETRLKVQQENAADETLRIRVVGTLESRLAVVSGGALKAADCTVAADIALRTLQLTFEREGLEFCAFLEDKRNPQQYPSIADNVDLAILEYGVTPPNDEIYKEAILETLRGTFYKSTPEERLFLSKLAHTYSLLFALQAEPRIAQYFEDMASDFYLYVGADLIVRALSERYVRQEDQRVRTLLKMIIDAGSTLILTEPVLEEVLQHLISTDYEFRTHFAAQESKITYQIARNCPKILIRAYFYARLDPPEGLKPPASWAAYLHQFCEPSRLTKPEGKEDLRKYLISSFRMRYESRDEIESLINGEKARASLYEITSNLTPHKATEALARNDALMALVACNR